MSVVTMNCFVIHYMSFDMRDNNKKPFKLNNPIAGYKTN